MVEVINTSHPVAKKEHRCQYCGEIIKVGESYTRQTNKYEGEIYDWICHDDCYECTSELDMFGRTWSDGIDGDEFSDFVWEAMNELRPDDEDIYEMSTHEAVQWLLAQPKEVIKKVIHY